MQVNQQQIEQLQKRQNWLNGKIEDPQITDIIELTQEERQVRRQIQYLDAEQKRLTNLMPLSNYGPIRVPRHINAKTVIGKANLFVQTANQNRTKEGQR